MALSCPIIKGQFWAEGAASDPSYLRERLLLPFIHRQRPPRARRVEQWDRHAPAEG